LGQYSFRVKRARASAAQLFSTGEKSATDFFACSKVSATLQIAILWDLFQAVSVHPSYDCFGFVDLRAEKANEIRACLISIKRLEIKPAFAQGRNPPKT